MPATCEPWPLSSVPELLTQTPVRQLARATTFRSGWVLSTPLSTTATSASMRTSSVPSMSRFGLLGPKMRLTPVGTVWTKACTSASGSTLMTFGLRLSCSAAVALRRAV